MEAGGVGDEVDGFALLYHPLYKGEREREVMRERESGTYLVG